MRCTRIAATPAAALAAPAAQAQVEGAHVAATSGDTVFAGDDARNAALLDALQAAEVPHAVRVFGGARHAVTVRGSEDYDLAADRASRDALENFLSDRF
ncbi:hypothetical protein DRV84_00955 [Rhodosalinus sediminis]|uniref:Dienelactone hydrolase domain-containing protein n=1 Tax=Rhodosalinus sediminis TaxID=1940533 RepID=A0A3D9BZ63_9RHOB|nr:dienelactone hydrolase family protein [Rhodosalinus sediminis]REC58827.1 hypothetical protein DRV84_00955 [Rhodosalinus sediminis]